MARRVWPYLRRYRGPMVLLVGVTAVDSAIVVVSTLILRLIIDDGILRHRESAVVTLAADRRGVGAEKLPYRRRRYLHSQAVWGARTRPWSLSWSFR
jgi:hypothetical protein